MNANPEGPMVKISIVTPSFNQGQYLEGAIRSVIGQSGCPVEYFVMDGASTDESVRVIERCSAEVSYWESLPDYGQSHALAKGFERATGEVFGWINSDDALEPGALHSVASAYRERPGHIVAGAVTDVDEAGNPVRTVKPRNITLESFTAPWTHSYEWHQPGVFFPASAYRAVGGLDVSLKYAMDHDLMCKMLAAGTPVHYIDSVLARFRLHPKSKTVAQSGAVVRETFYVAWKYWVEAGRSPAYFRWRLLLDEGWKMVKDTVRGRGGAAASFKENAGFINRLRLPPRG